MESHGKRRSQRCLTSRPSDIAGSITRSGGAIAFHESVENADGYERKSGRGNARADRLRATRHRIIGDAADLQPGL